MSLTGVAAVAAVEEGYVRAVVCGCGTVRGWMNGWEMCFFGDSFLFLAWWKGGGGGKRDVLVCMAEKY